MKEYIKSFLIIELKRKIRFYEMQKNIVGRCASTQIKYANKVIPEFEEALKELDLIKVTK